MDIKKCHSTMNGAKKERRKGLADSKYKRLPYKQDNSFLMLSSNFMATTVLLNIELAPTWCNINEMICELPTI